MFQTAAREVQWQILCDCGQWLLALQISRFVSLFRHMRGWCSRFGQPHSNSFQKHLDFRNERESAMISQQWSSKHKTKTHLRKRRHTHCEHNSGRCLFIFMKGTLLTFIIHCLVFWDPRYGDHAPLKIQQEDVIVTGYRFHVAGLTAGLRYVGLIMILGSSSRMTGLA